MQGHWECPPKMNKCQPVLRDSGLRRGCLWGWITDRWHTAGWGSLRGRNKVSFPSYLLQKALQQEYPHLPTLEDEGKKGKSVLCTEGREEQQRRAWLWQQRCLGEDSRPITSLTLGPWAWVLVPSSLTFLLYRLRVQVIIIPASRGSYLVELLAQCAQHVLISVNDSCPQHHHAFPVTHSETPISLYCQKEALFSCCPYAQESPDSCWSGTEFWRHYASPPGNSTFSPQNTLEGPACLQILKAVLLFQLWSLLNNSNFPVIQMLKHNFR